MKKFCIVVMALVMAVFLGYAAPADAAPAPTPCLKITLTGTMGGPNTFGGLAGPGTLVRYGDTSNGCNALKLQFDVGRGTNVQLSALGITPGQLNAIFITHLHSDHVDGFSDIMQNRWHNRGLPLGVPLDIVCSDDANSPAGHTMSCEDFGAAIGDAFIASGEIEQRVVENGLRDTAGPAALSNMNVITFVPGVPALVWSSGDVTVNAIQSTHIPGHASYRVDTPAGSVVIGGDAGNDNPDPATRDHSTSDQVESFAAGADVLVHSAIHPVLAPGSGFPPPFFNRQSTATDLGALADRAGVKHLMLTHLIPSLGAERAGPAVVPGGPLDKGDYKDAVKAGGFNGDIRVGLDLMTLQIP